MGIWRHSDILSFLLLRINLYFSMFWYRDSKLGLGIVTLHFIISINFFLKKKNCRSILTAFFYTFFTDNLNRKRYYLSDFRDFINLNNFLRKFCSLSLCFLLFYA